MSVSECVKFEQKLAYFMAPSLLGIKCASLMSINKTEFSVLEHLERFNARAHAKGLKLRLLCDCTNRALILLYQETLLQQQLQNSQVQLILRQQGYAEPVNLEAALQQLSERIRCSGEFPHEIGLFLSYPPEDVLGFICNRACNHKCVGCWKVYGDERQARQTFDRYKKCTQTYCERWRSGVELERLAVADRIERKS